MRKKSGGSSGRTGVLGCCIASRLCLVQLIEPKVGKLRNWMRDGGNVPVLRLSTLLHVVVYWWQLAAFMRLKMRQEILGTCQDNDVA